MPLQYKIPQNVGIEDKIVGPLTLRQLIILAAGFGISYVMFAIASKLYELNILEYIVILIPALLASALALIKINNVTLTKFLFMFLEFSIKPKKRLWDHRGILNIVAPDLSEGKAEAMPEASTAIEDKAKKASNLGQLSQVLDSGGFEHLNEVEHDDIDESHDDDLITQAYFGNKKTDTDNMYWRSKESHKKRLDLFAKLPTTQLKAGSKEAEMAKEQIAQAKAEAEQPKQTAQAPAAVAAKPAKKKNRPRNRPVTQPARANNQVNTTNKSQPAKFPTKEEPAVQAQPTPPAAPSTETDPTMGELHFEELKKGDIELNLD